MGKLCVGNNIRFSIATFDLIVNIKSLENWDQCPPLLSSFITSVHDSRTAMFSYKWIKDDDFCLEKISDRSYSSLRRKWLEGYVDGTEQIFSHIANNAWTVFFSAERRYALGIGPTRYFFDIFRSALDLAYIKLSIANNFLVLHSAAILVSGKCLLFLAISGGGKTTLSENAIKHGYEVLSDDRVFVIHDTNKYFAHGTPFGNFGLNKGGYPIAGIFILEQSDQNLIEPVSNIDVFEQVWFIEYKRRRRCFGGVSASRFFTQFMDFLNYHPTFCLKFRKDFDDWDHLSQVVEFLKKSK